MLHVLIILFRKLFNYLCKRLDIVIDDDGVLAWSDVSCGLIECIFDKEV